MVLSDWGLVAFVFLAVGVDCMRAGVGRSIACALSFSSASVLLNLLPHTVMLESVTSRLSGVYASSLTYAVFFILSYVAIRRMTSSYGDMGGEVLSSFFSALAVTFLLLAFWVTTPALSALWMFGPFFQSVFASAYTLWWMLAGYTILAVTR